MKKLWIAILLLCWIPVCRAATPVILDTDIGNDIDDTWALTLLLKNPRLELKLITTTDGQQEYRAALLAKLLTIANRTDIPIGMGAGRAAGEEREKSWLADFKLSSYSGIVHRDGVRALIDAVHASKEPITIIAIGPLQTLARAIEVDPTLPSHAYLVGMQGSVFKGYGGSNKPVSEFNIHQDIPAAQKVLAAPWLGITLTPLDTCGVPGMILHGDEFRAIQASPDPMNQAILQSYASWAHTTGPGAMHESTLLYDTVAIYLADPAGQPLLVKKVLPITVTTEGVTAVTEKGQKMTIATDWKDVAAYRTWIVSTLVGK